MAEQLITQEHLEQLRANRADEKHENPPVVQISWNGYPWGMLVHSIQEDDDTLAGIVQDCMEVAGWGEASLAEMLRIHNGTHEEQHLKITAHTDFEPGYAMHHFSYAVEEEGIIPQKPSPSCDVCGHYYPGDEPCIEH